MTAVCTSNCCIDTVSGGRPPRAAYINLYKWTDSNGEIVKSAIPRAYRRVPVADGISCRQMYLRSYKFSTKESAREKTRRCLRKVKEKLLGQRKRRRSRKRKCLIWKKMKKFSCSFVLFGIFRRILSCAASIDVVDQRNGRNGNRFWVWKFFDLFFLLLVVHHFSSSYSSLIENLIWILFVFSSSLTESSAWTCSLLSHKILVSNLFFNSQKINFLLFLAIIFSAVRIEPLTS